VDFVGWSAVGLLAQRLSVPACEVKGQGSYTRTFLFPKNTGCLPENNFTFSITVTKVHSGLSI